MELHFLIILLLFALILCIFKILTLRLIIKKLTRQISELNNKLSESEKKVRTKLEEIKLLKWQIVHPPKYNKGHKFDLWIITSHELHKPSLSDFLAKALISFIGVCAGYMPIKKSTDLDMYWEYELTHTANGEKKKMSESQLVNFKPEEKQ